MKKITVPIIQAMKGKEKITALTCYSFFHARMMDDIGIEILLVGDSVGNVVLGYDSTIPVTMQDMLHHVKAVNRGISNSHLVADMPFMSYQASDEEAIKNAGLFIQEGGAVAVKLEGGIAVCDRIRAIVNMGIPVMGHIGLLPQSVHSTGGYKMQGKTEDEASRVVEDAKAVEAAGSYAVVLECIPENVAKKITKSLKIPTIGIGAGRFCDGQILVADDMLGLTEGMKRFVKVYDNLGEKMKNAIARYKDDVKEKRFPEINNVIM